MLGEDYERLAPIVYAIIVAEDYNRPKFTRAIAELERRTGITRARLRRMKANASFIILTRHSLKLLFFNAHMC